MRPLTEDESKAVFTKLANYIVGLIHLLQNQRTHLLTGKKSGSPHRPPGRAVLLQAT